MLETPMNVPTETLIDMLVAIVVEDVALTANDVANVEQIQRELRGRRDEQHWGCLSFSEGGRPRFRLGETFCAM